MDTELTNNIDPERTGERLRQLRDERGYTREHLAGLLYITPMAICKWERGITVPSLDSLAKLCELYGVGLDNIIVFTNDTVKAASA